MEWYLVYCLQREHDRASKTTTPLTTIVHVLLQRIRRRRDLFFLFCFVFAFRLRKVNHRSTGCAQRLSVVHVNLPTTDAASSSCARHSRKTKRYACCCGTHSCSGGGGVCTSQVEKVFGCPRPTCLYCHQGEVTT